MYYLKKYVFKFSYLSKLAYLFFSWESSIHHTLWEFVSELNLKWDRKHDSEEKIPKTKNLNENWIQIFWAKYGNIYRFNILTVVDTCRKTPNFKNETNSLIYIFFSFVGYFWQYSVLYIYLSEYFPYYQISVYESYLRGRLITT